MSYEIVNDLLFVIHSETYSPFDVYVLNKNGEELIHIDRTVDSLFFENYTVDDGHLIINITLDVYEC